MGMAAAIAPREPEDHLYDSDRELIAITDVLSIVHYKDRQMIIFQWRWPQRYMKYDYSHMKLPKPDLKAWKPLSESLMSHILR
jgi:hypothetical protein